MSEVNFVGVLTTYGCLIHGLINFSSVVSLYCFFSYQFIR